MTEVAITLDIDWAPDCAIDLVSELLTTSNVRATWFVTHISPAVQRLRAYPELFELGIHPNFLEGSTHGIEPEAVLHHCSMLVPEARSMRTHALMQSTPILDQVLTLTPISTDVSLFLPYAARLEPVEYRRMGRRLLRVPYFWEDDFEMENEQPCWELKPLLQLGEGLKVFDFHPIHIYLNSSNVGPYQGLKQEVLQLNEATPETAAAYVHSGEGTRTIFVELLDHLMNNGHACLIRDIHRRWKMRKDVQQARVSNA